MTFKKISFRFDVLKTVVSYSVCKENHLTSLVNKNSLVRIKCELDLAVFAQVSMLFVVFVSILTCSIPYNFGLPLNNGYFQPSCSTASKNYTKNVMSNSYTLTF